MRVFVTGPGGFVGSYLLPRLAAAGHEALSAPADCDVTDPKAVMAAVAQANPEAIVHLAARSSVAESMNDPHSVFRTNYLGSLHVLRAVAQRAPGARVLLIGSGQQYGSTGQDRAPFLETDPMRPESPYARSKAAADLLGAQFAARDLDVVRTRSFNHTGPGQASQMVVPNFARQIAEIERGLREPHLRVGNLESVRDFLDVSDVVEAYLRLLDPAVPADVYNVASGAGHSMGELLETLLSLSDVKPTVEVEPSYFRPTDRSVGDPRRLHETTGWEPSIPFRQILSRILDYWRKYLDKHDS